MGMPWRMVGKILVVVDLILINLLIGFFIFKSQILNPDDQTGTKLQNPNTYTYLEVDNKLIRLKEEIMAEVLVAGQSGTPVPSLIPEPTASVKPTLPVWQAPKTKTRTVAYVTIPGSGRSNLFSWQDLTGTEFYFDKADYPGLVEVYFEANISLLNGNGRADVRLFDATHGIGVQGGEVESNSQTAAIKTSGKLNFWSGKNLYRIQAKTLTADTTIYNYGRLRIVTEN